MLYLAAYALATVAAMSLFTAGLGGSQQPRSPQWGHRFGLACCTLTIFIGGFWLFAG